jgi:hypothetical protein
MALSPDSFPVAVCTAADGGFFPLLRDMVEALVQRGGETKHQLCILDMGLASDHIAWLTSKGAQIVEAQWDIDFPERDQQPGHFRAQTARAFLPRYFPGFKTYIWLDADTWIQDGAVLHWLVKATEHNAMAVTEELHQAYRKAHNQRDILYKAAVIRTFYGDRDADVYGLLPTLNSGVFAIRADAPHWQAWAEEMSALLHRKCTRYVDQLSLERIVHAHRLPVAYLPARANWVVSQARPAFCADRGKLVDPLPPHDPLWVIHLTLGSKDIAFPIPFLDGRTVTKTLRLSDIGPLVGIFPKDA